MYFNLIPDVALFVWTEIETSTCSHRSVSNLCTDNYFIIWTFTSLSESSFLFIRFSGLIVLKLFEFLRQVGWHCAIIAVMCENTWDPFY